MVHQECLELAACYHSSFLQYGNELIIFLRQHTVLLQEVHSTRRQYRTCTGLEVRSIITSLRYTRSPPCWLGIRPVVILRKTVGTAVTSPAKLLRAASLIPGTCSSSATSRKG